MNDVTIEWINHAGYLLEYGETKLVVDPWLSGSVFDGGWELLAESCFTDDDWNGVSHIWFSHEHPDHFHPPSLLSIPPAARDRAEVLFQETRDRRVVDWCDGRFGSVRELPAERWVEIGPDVEVMCGPHDNGDSWLAVRTPDAMVLNLNDCVITTAAQCDHILRLTGQPDVLLSQFSYANWTGNPGDVALMAAAADEKLSWLTTQIERLKPAVTIPFASFVWFGHEDNAHLNDGMLPVAEVVDRLRRTGASIQLLYPGDRWSVGPVDDTLTTAAVDRYSDDVTRWASCAPRSGEAVSLDQLTETAERWGSELRRRNGPAVRLLPSARIHLIDHGTTFRLTAQGLESAELDRDQCDLDVRSDALNAALSVPYGGRTLDINGRFAVPSGGNYRRFKALATLAAFNARDESWLAVTETMARRTTARARRFAARGRRRPSTQYRIGDIDQGVLLAYRSGRAAAADLELGADATVRSGSTLYAGSTIGHSLATGHNVVIREQCRIGDQVSIWSNSVIDYGCVIGDGVKIHCNCYIAQYTVIEDGAFLAPGVSIANDLYPGDERSAEVMAGPVIEAGAQIGIGAVLLPFVRIGAGAIVGAGAVVTGDVPAGTVVYGNPAKPHGRVADLPPIDLRAPVDHPIAPRVRDNQ